METRDNLALCAMQVMLKHEWKTRISLYNRARRLLGLNYTTYVGCNLKRIAQNSYELADAMLEASEKQHAQYKQQD